MAIAPLAQSTGTFSTLHNLNNGDRSGVEQGKRNGHILYKIDLRFNTKFNANEHIKWCRRNLGERSHEWDFWLAGEILYIEVWGDKAKFTYEMFKN